MLSLLKELSVYRVMEEEYGAGAKGRMESEAYEQRERRRQEIKQEMHGLAAEKKDDPAWKSAMPWSFALELQGSKSTERSLGFITLRNNGGGGRVFVSSRSTGQPETARPHDGQSWPDLNGHSQRQWCWP